MTNRAEESKEENLFNNLELPNTDPSSHINDFPSIMWEVRVLLSKYWTIIHEGDTHSTFEQQEVSEICALFHDKHVVLSKKAVIII